MHRTTMSCALLIIPMLFGCTGHNDNSSPPSSPSSTPSSNSTPPVSSAPADTGAANPAPGASSTSAAASDNSGVNERDRSGQTLTPPDQAKSDSSDADTKILGDIRRAIVNDDSLSTNGHNVKIIVKNGVATLRGPVPNAAERARIGDIAAKVAGVTSVDNQLDVAP